MKLLLSYVVDVCIAEGRPVSIPGDLKSCKAKLAFLCSHGEIEYHFLD